MFVARNCPSCRLSPVGTGCVAPEEGTRLEHAVPTGLKRATAFLLQTCRSYGTFKELFDLLTLGI